MGRLKGLELDLAVAAGEFLAILLVGWLLNFLIGRLFDLIFGIKKDKARPRTLERIKKVLGRSLGFLTIVVAIAITGLNAYLVLSRKGILRTQLDYAAHITPEVRNALLLGLLKLTALTWLCSAGLKLLERYLKKACIWAKGLGKIEQNDESIERLFESLSTVTTRLGWLCFTWLAASMLGVPEVALGVVMIGIRVYGIIAIGLLLWRALDVAIGTLAELSKKAGKDKGWMTYYERLEFLVPLARRSLEYIIYASFASMAVAQVSFVASLAEWGPRTVRVIGYFFLARVAVAVMTLVTDEWASRKSKNDQGQNQRILTLVPLFLTTQKYAVYFFVAVAILHEIGVDPGPILAGAGIAGLAVGFGAQSVIKDIVTGFFILFENYFVVGDFVQIGDTRGIVMGVDLRTTRLRDLEGGLHIIPNGDVTHVIHYSKEYSNALVDIGVSYDSDLDEVRAVLLQTGQRLKDLDPRVLQPTEVLGVHSLGESDVVIRTLTRCQPGRHFEVGRAFREQAKVAFDKAGIEIPFARRVLIFKDESNRDVPPPVPGQTSA